MISRFNLAIPTSITITRNINRQDLAAVPALSSMLSTSFFFGFDDETLLSEDVTPITLVSFAEHQKN